MSRSSSLQADVVRNAYSKAYAEAAEYFAAQLRAKDDDVVRLKEKVSELTQQVDSATEKMQQAIADRNAAVAATADAVKAAKESAKGHSRALC